MDQATAKEIIKDTEYLDGRILVMEDTKKIKFCKIIWKGFSETQKDEDNKEGAARVRVKDLMTGKEFTDNLTKIARVFPPEMISDKEIAKANILSLLQENVTVESKTLGWITTVIFTLLGGLFVIRSGVLKAMFLAGIIMASTNLLFSLLAWSDKSELLFAIAVIFDDIAAAFATVAFVAFISLLVDRAYTATQYALLASIGTAGRTTLASSSGALVDWLNGDWGTFFILTALMVIPSLIILWILRNKLKLYEK